MSLFPSYFVYVASSWRNPFLDDVSARLRRGVQTYDFREHDGFHWQDVFPDWGNDWPNNGEMDATMVLAGMQSEPAEVMPHVKALTRADECDFGVICPPALRRPESEAVAHLPVVLRGPVARRAVLAAAHVRVREREVAAVREVPGV
jgi:hypothetical protein